MPQTKTVNLSEDAVEDLIDVLQDTDKSYPLRSQAASILGKITPVAKKTIDALMEVIKSEDEDRAVRRSALYSLGVVGVSSQRVMDFLAELMKGTKDRDLAREAGSSLSSLVYRRSRLLRLEADTLGLSMSIPKEQRPVPATESFDREDLAIQGRNGAKQRQKTRSLKYLIGVKPGGNVTIPSKYKSVSESKFADPVNYRYPMDAAHVLSARQYFNHADQQSKGGYNDREWAILGRRITSASGEAFQYRKKQVIRKKSAA